MTFLVSRPLVAATESSARLILPTAESVRVTLSRGGVAVLTGTVAIVDNKAAFGAQIEARVNYDVTAEALDSLGLVRFRGQTAVRLTENRKLILYLLPVAPDGTPWPVIAASNQPLIGPSPTQTTPTSGTSSSFLIDFGTTATEFTFTPWPSDIDLYAQHRDGSPLVLDDGVVTLTELAGDTAFWLTAHQTGTGTVGSIGTFTIPLKSLSLPSAHELGQGVTLDLNTLLTKTPANATNGAITWTLDPPGDPGTLTTAGVLTAASPVSPAVSLSGVARVTSVADPAIAAAVNLTVWGPSYSRLSNLVLAVDGVNQGITFDQLTMSYSLADARSPTLTQELGVTATQGTAGQTLEWSADGTTWTSLTSGVESPIPLNQGAQTIQIRVTAPNGVDTNTYLVPVNKLVVPAQVLLSPTTATLATNAIPQVVFTPSILPTQVLAGDSGVSWTVDRADLASIDSAGMLTPLLPGTVSVTATSIANPTVSGTAVLTLTPSSYTLKATSGAFWTDLAGSPTLAPSGTIAIAGNDTTLVALKASGELWTRDNGVWVSLGLSAPLATQWIVLDDGGQLWAATPTRVYGLSMGLWSTDISLPPVGIRGLVGTSSGLEIWGSDYGLWSYAGTAWTKESVTIPTGTTALVGGPGPLLAVVGTQFQEFSSGVWSPRSLPVLPQTVSSTFAYGQLISLIVR